MHYIGKTLKVYGMRYRLQMWYFFVLKILKKHKKENDEIKKCGITRKN